VRLGAERPEGAREAISAPLTEARLSIAPDLLDVLLIDLQAAATAIGPEIGWGAAAAIYPPHLQLACSVLYDALRPGEAVLTLAHYRKLGGLDAIVGEYLDRVLETELDADAVAVARDLFLALVTSAHTRAMRTEAELMDIVSGRHRPQRVADVLQVLHARGLLVRLRAAGGEPAWELIHDSLVPRVLGWIDRRDLARRRAVELVRYHLRRSRPDAPSLLNRAELRELRANPDAVSELEAEWAQRRSEQVLTPAILVTASQRLLRRRAVMFAGAGVAALAVAGVPLQRWMAEREIRQQEQTLRDRDMGRFALELVPFDWDVDQLKPIPVSADRLPNLHWQLYEPNPDDPDSPGDPLPESLVVRSPAIVATDHLSRTEHVEARGGRAFLLVTGRGQASEACSESIIFLRQLPGYAQRDRAEKTLRVVVPTCQTTRADTIEIPAGTFVHGGVGDPPSGYMAALEEAPPEKTLDLPAFWIDRTEVTNAAFSMYGQIEEITGTSMPPYPNTDELHNAGGPSWPVAGITWVEARAYCRFLGKELPTSEQWEKAMRGGVVLAGGEPNPMPRRNLPWGTPVTPAPARLKDVGGAGPAAVGDYAGDISPYGVLGMAGNVQEWTGSVASTGTKLERAFRIARGGNWGDATSDTLVDYMASENGRFMDTRYFNLGVRCSLRPP
jgi:formylglycine-generating enzyme required for sulfatase activity